MAGQPCGRCGGRRRGEPPPESLKALRSGYPGPKPNAKGMYPMAAAPDCDEPYWGEFNTANVYVVGQQTELEKIFRRSQKREASAYARQHDLEIRPYLARSLPRDAMVAFFGS